MAQVRGTLPILYDNIDKALNVVIGDQLQELSPEWEQVYNIKSSSKKFERVSTVVPFGAVPEKPEGNVYALDIIQQGRTKDFTHIEFGLGFEATQTAMEDDEYDVLIRAAEWLAWTARDTQGTYAARPFNNGFTTETTPDGYAWFYASHPLIRGGTAANCPSAHADLSFNSLVAAIVDMGKNCKLESGQLMTPPESMVLYVPYDLEFTAHRILNSTLVPGTADNDTNPLKRRRIEILVGPKLTDTDAWFLLASPKRKHALTTYERVKVGAQPQATDPWTGNLLKKVRFRQSWGVWDWRNSYGTSGA